MENKSARVGLKKFGCSVMTWVAYCPQIMRCLLLGSYVGGEIGSFRLAVCPAASAAVLVVVQSPALQQ